MPIDVVNITFPATAGGKILQVAVSEDGGSSYANSLYPLSTQTQVEFIKNLRLTYEPVTPDDPYDGYNSGGFDPDAFDYKVIVRTSGQDPLLIDMGQIDNQSGWLNTLAGTNQAIADIRAQLP